MRIEVRHSNIPISEALEAYIQRKLGRALMRFQERVADVAVRLVDENGPRGGVDLRCRVVVGLVGGRQIVVQGVAEDAYAAVTRAAVRLNGQVKRAVGRGKPVHHERAEVSAEDQAPRPVVSESDLERLRALIDSATARDQEAAEALEAELYRAEIVPTEQLPPTVVRLGSQVVFADDETGEEREVTLVLPKEADTARGRVSVLAPIGAALIGLSVGDAIDWPVPGGRSRRLRIVDVPAPSAAGRAAQ